MDNRDLFRAVNRFVRENFPEMHPSELIIRVSTTRGPCSPIRLPIPVGAPRRAKPRPFVPTAYQRAILDALDGVAMKTDDLAAKVGSDRRRLFVKPGGIQELKDEGLVESHPRLGYYRPDSPPEALA